MIARLTSATPKHATAISTILSDWIDETPWMPRIHTPEQDLGFGRWLIEVSEVTVAIGKDRVVGFISRQDHEVQALYLSTDARRTGIGRRLLDHCKSQTHRLGLWTFQQNQLAQRFYQSNGFVIDRMTDGQGNDEKLPDMRLIWSGDAG